MESKTTLEKEVPVRDCLHCAHLVTPTDGDPQMFLEYNDYCQKGFAPYINKVCLLFETGSSLPHSLGK